MVAYPTHTGPESAHAAHNQVDLNPGLRGTIQGGDDVLIQQRVHLGNDVRRAPVAGVFRLAGDERKASLGEIQRRHHQGIVIGVLSVCGQKTKNIVNRGGDLRVGSEETHISVDTRGGGVVIAGA